MVYLSFNVEEVFKFFFIIWPFFLNIVRTPVEPRGEQLKSYIYGKHSSTSHRLTASYIVPNASFTTYQMLASRKHLVGGDAFTHDSEAL